MSRSKLANILLDNFIWVVLLLVLLFFALKVNNFLTGTNMVSILLEASVLGIVTIGQAICLMSGNFDLSAEGTLTLMTVLAAWLMLPARSASLAQAGGIGWQVSPFIVVPLILALGTFIGWINGVLITKLNINNFIVTLAMQLILRGVALVISWGMVMPGTPATFNWLGVGAVGPIPVSVLATLLLFVVFHVVLRYTRFGRELFAVGGNRQAALASGFNPQRLITVAYMVGGFLAALAGWMLLGRVQTSVPTLGAGLTLQTIAAGVIGGVALQGGAGTALGAFAGVMLLAVINNGMNLMEVNPFWVNGIRGLIILIALLIEAQKGRLGMVFARTRS
jgi:ribose/xylose/arabinose/galactoside ABC-type transport system permease subunit